MPNPNHLWYLEIILPNDERPQRVFSSRESMYDWAHDNGLKPRVVKHDSPNKRHDYTCISSFMFDVWSD